MQGSSRNRSEPGRGSRYGERASPTSGCGLAAAAGGIRGDKKKGRGRPNKKPFPLDVPSRDWGRSRPFGGRSRARPARIDPKSLPRTRDFGHWPQTQKVHKVTSMAPELRSKTGFGVIHGPKPYYCVGFGDIHGSHRRCSVVGQTGPQRALRSTRPGSQLHAGGFSKPSTPSKAASWRLREAEIWVPEGSLAGFLGVRF